MEKPGLEQPWFLFLVVILLFKRSEFRNLALIALIALYEQLCSVASSLILVP